MRPRKQMTMIELMVMIAIFGILAAITLPTLKQAKDRAQAGRGPAVRRSVEPDGQLNTIEVSELSPSADDNSSQELTRLISSLLPVALVAIVAAVVIASARRQMSGHAKQ